MTGIQVHKNIFIQLSEKISVKFNFIRGFKTKAFLNDCKALIFY